MVNTVGSGFGPFAITSGHLDSRQPGVTVSMQLACLVTFPKCHDLLFDLSPMVVMRGG